jgi:hypothetical protein
LAIVFPQTCVDRQLPGDAGLQTLFEWPGSRDQHNSVPSPFPFPPLPSHFLHPTTMFPMLYPKNECAQMTSWPFISKAWLSGQLVTDPTRPHTHTQLPRRWKTDPVCGRSWLHTEPKPGLASSSVDSAENLFLQLPVCLG